MRVACVLWTDRHSDPTVHLFTDADAAIDWARAQAKKMDRHDDFKETELTDEMRNIGWIYDVQYSCEGDGLRVEMVEVDKDVTTLRRKDSK